MNKICKKCQGKSIQKFGKTDGRQRYKCMEALILAIHRQISYYNTKRLHTTLRDTPRGFREKYEEKQEFIEQKMKESNEGKK